MESEPIVKDSDIWCISELANKHFGILYHQFGSYNDFIETGIPFVLENNRRLEVSVLDQETGETKTCTVEFENINFVGPNHKENNEEIDIVTPKECIDRDITYKADMYLDYVLTNPYGAKIVHTDEYFGSIPVMVKSRLCHLYPYRHDFKALAKLKEDVMDPGGYFIIKGNQKVIASQERTAYNIVYVFRNRKTSPKYELFAEIRSSSKERAHSTTVQLGYIKDRISVVVPYIESGPIPVGIIYKALGVVDENDILRVIWELFPQEFRTSKWYSQIVFSLEDSYDCKSQEDALYYIGSRGKKFRRHEGSIPETGSNKETISYAKHLLSREFIPHVGESFSKKIMYVSYMIKKLLYVKMDLSEPEDRDHFGNKRVATTGVLFMGQFHNAFRKIRSDISESIERDLKSGATINIRSYIKPKIMVSAFENALSNNVWGSNKIVGVSQAFDRFNYISSLANLRKTVTPMNKDGGKIVKPRKLHSSQYGVTCPGGTPEGKKCITLDSDILTPYGLKKMEDMKNRDMVVTINPVTMKVSFTKIKNYFVDYDEVYLIELDGGLKIEATRDHAFLCMSITLPYHRWETIGGLSPHLETSILAPGSYLATYVNDSVQFRCIISVTSMGIKSVADFTTDSDNHSFVANGIVTHNCGFIKDIALQAIITIGSNPNSVTEIIRGMKMSYDIENHEFKNPTLIFVNGDPISVTPNPEKMTKKFRKLRRTASINPEISILYKKHSNEIYVSTDAGRMMYPLLIVNDGKLKITPEIINKIQYDEDWNSGYYSGWSRLFSEGYVELIDKIEEEETLQVSYPSDLHKLSKEKRLRITHCTLDPILAVGVGVSLIPKSDSNQAPRNSYEASMCKQAIGIPQTNWRFHTKGKIHVLNYPQKQLIATKNSKLLGTDIMSTGQNAVVAVCPMQGFGQEDSIIMNLDSIRRGFMNITTLVSYNCKVRKEKGEQFEIPNIRECNNFKGNISKLDPDTCCVPIGVTVENGDVIIGMTRGFNRKMTIYHENKTSESIIYDQICEGTVHSVLRGTDGKGYEAITIVIAQQRTPQFGDKFAGVAGQKGTVGMVYESTDLPFTQDGIAPDIIINPLCLPSRMTIGMLIEMLMGKKVCSTFKSNTLLVKEVFKCDDDGFNPVLYELDKQAFEDTPKYSENKAFSDATPYNKSFNLIRDVVDELKVLGYDGFGEEMMTCGITGKPIKTLIYTGICYYQRLKHMSADKIHARSKGGKATLTRQPKEGRKFGGGLKTGTMEKDAILSQGGAAVAKDRLMDQSDAYEMYVCDICGLPAVFKVEEQKGECRLCQDSQVSKIPIPYGAKLALQEFAGMNIIARVMTTSYK